MSEVEIASSEASSHTCPPVIHRDDVAGGARDDVQSKVRIKKGLFHFIVTRQQRVQLSIVALCYGQVDKCRVNDQL